MVHGTKIHEKRCSKSFQCVASLLAIVCGPTTYWDMETLWRIMACCVILQDMVTDNASGQSINFDFEIFGALVTLCNGSTIHMVLEVHRQIEYRQNHVQLRENLIEH